MTLDDDKDGHVSFTDAKKSIVKTKDFLSTIIAEDILDMKISIYKDAIKYMQRELAEDKKNLQIQD
jgi:hypothetical protein